MFLPPPLLPPCWRHCPHPSSPPPDVATCKERLRVLTVGGMSNHNAGVSLQCRESRLESCSRGVHRKSSTAEACRPAAVHHFLWTPLHQGARRDCSPDSMSSSRVLLHKWAEKLQRSDPEVSVSHLSQTSNISSHTSTYRWLSAHTRVSLTHNDSVRVIWSWKLLFIKFCITGIQIFKTVTSTLINVGAHE